MAETKGSRLKKSRTGQKVGMSRAERAEHYGERLDSARHELRIARYVAHESAQAFLLALQNQSFAARPPSLRRVAFLAAQCWADAGSVLSAARVVRSFELRVRSDASGPFTGHALTDWPDLQALAFQRQDARRRKAEREAARVDREARASARRSA